MKARNIYFEIAENRELVYVTYKDMTFEEAYKKLKKEHSEFLLYSVQTEY